MRFAQTRRVVRGQNRIVKLFESDLIEVTQPIQMKKTYRALPTEIVGSSCNEYDENNGILSVDGPMQFKFVPGSRFTWFAQTRQMRVISIVRERERGPKM